MSDGNLFNSSPPLPLRPRRRNGRISHHEKKQAKIGISRQNPVFNTLIINPHEARAVPNPLPLFFLLTLHTSLLPPLMPNKKPMENPQRADMNQWELPGASPTGGGGWKETEHCRKHSQTITHSLPRQCTSCTLQQGAC